MTPLRQRMLDELQRATMQPTRFACYILAIEQFAEYFHKSPERLGGEEIRRFELHLLQRAGSWRPEPSRGACPLCASFTRRS